MTEQTEREIPLTKGYVALVSKGDYERVNAFKWHALVGTHTVYAVRNVRVDDKKHKMLMHRFVLDASDGSLVDHKDGNGLNNVRGNIRLATHVENQQNRCKSSKNTSGYVGVSWCQEKNKWESRIRMKGKKLFLGRYDCPIEAAKARDAKAKELHGDFATLNFPEESHD